jgi:hypothetical protein
MLEEVNAQNRQEDEKEKCNYGAGSWLDPAKKDDESH